MKKLLFLSFLILTSLSVMAQNKDSLSNNDMNKVIVDTVSNKPMLIGKCNRDAFSDSTFAWWFKPTYQIYDVDSTTLKGAADKLKDINITIVMGSWCSDSKMQVPHFYKILDYLKYPSDNVNLILVDRKIHAEGNELEGLDISRVPTFIFFKDQKEIGRITEFPKASLEVDMMKILE